MDLEPIHAGPRTHRRAEVAFDDPTVERRRRRREQRIAERRRTRRIVAVAVLTGIVVLVGTVLALALPGDIPRGASIVDASELALKPAIEPAPPRIPERPHLLDTIQIEGAPAHPYWEERLGWRATGARLDELGGRSITSVFYERGGQRVGYSIVDGARFPPPVATTDVVVNRIPLRSFLVNGRHVVTWTRRERTCILSGRDVKVDVLLSLAGTLPTREMLLADPTAKLETPP